MVVKFGSDLEKLIASEVNALGFELIGIELDNNSNQKLLRVYADTKPHRSSDATMINTKFGITVDDCGKISYHLNKVLSVDPNLQASEYNLEVSSPGLERRLFNLSQMDQYLGSLVKLCLVSSFNDRKNWLGVLHSTNHILNKVSLEIDGQNFDFDFDNIAKANLVYRKL